MRNEFTAECNGKTLGGWPYSMSQDLNTLVSHDRKQKQKWKATDCSSETQTTTEADVLMQ